MYLKVSQYLLLSDSKKYRDLSIPRGISLIMLVVFHEDVWNSGTRTIENLLKTTVQISDRTFCVSYLDISYLRIFCRSGLSLIKPNQKSKVLLYKVYSTIVHLKLAKTNGTLILTSLDRKLNTIFILEQVNNIHLVTVICTLFQVVHRNCTVFWLKRTDKACKLVKYLVDVNIFFFSTGKRL